MRVIFGCGGTGGHLYPALAIAEKIKKEEPDSEILFMGSKGGLESEVVPREGYAFKSIPTKGMQARDTTMQKAVLSAQVGMSNLVGLTKAMNTIRKFKPDAIIGTGGYVCFPILLAGEILKIPCYIHEQNAVPGRANKALAKQARKLFVGFKGTEDIFGYPEKTIFTGNPVRSEFSNLNQKESRERLGISEEDFVVFAFGGSLGARTINEIAIEYMDRSRAYKSRTILFGTGRRFFDEYVDRCRDMGIGIENINPDDKDGAGIRGSNSDMNASDTEKRIRISGYINNMKDYISAADLMICRAGALSLAELMVAGKPAIIVPIPNSVGNHQFHNAKSVADGGGAFLVEESNMDIDDICEKIEYLSANKSALKKMGEACRLMASVDAADRIYEEIKS